MSRNPSPVLIAVCVCLTVHSAFARTMLLDFETDDDRTVWHDEHRKGIGDGKILERVAEFATSGRYALRVTIPAWRPAEHGGRYKWPAFECRPPVTDWSRYDRLVFDVTNVTSEPQRLMMFISDSEKPTRSGLLHRLRLPAYGHVRAVVDLRRGFRAKHLDAGDIHVMHVFTENPPVKMVVYLDAFQLLEPGEKPLPIPAGYLRDFAELQRKCFATLRRSLLDAYAGMERQAAGAPEEAARLRRAGQAAEQRLNALATLLQAAGPEVLDIPQAVARMQQELEGLRPALELALRFRRIQPRVLAKGASRRDVIAGFATSMEKILPRRPGPEFTISDHVEVRLARNEWESFQVIVLPRDGDLKDVSVQVSDLRSDNGAVFPGSAIQTVLTGYVRTKAPPPYDSRAWVGWWPDPILNFLHAADIRKGDAQSFWVRLHAPENQPRGRYRGTLTLRTGHTALMTFRLDVRVYDFAVPKVTPLPLAITFHPHDHPTAETRALQTEWRKSPDYPINAWKKHWTEWADFLADYYITFDSLYSYGGEGAPQFDLLERLNKQGRLGRFNLGYFGLAPPTPEKTAKWKQELPARLRPRYEKARALGILDHAYLYGCDEANKPTFPRLQRAAEILKQAFPDVPVMTTARDKSYGMSSGVTAVDWWCPLTPAYDRKKADAARAAGKQVWWYICCGPGHPYANMFIEFPAIEGRLLMGAMTAKYRPDGFLYYQISIWNSRRPIEKGPFTDWDPRSWTTYHGDGSWTCVGPDGTPLPTIRLENFRDGLEDYAYCRILEQRLRAIEADPQRKNAAAKWINRAKELLAVPDDVVRSMRVYTHSPAVLYRWRDAVAEAVEAADAF